MPKNLLLGAALIWTGIVLILGLMKVSGLPGMGLQHGDKIVHFLLHFLFTVLWFGYYTLKQVRFSNAILSVLGFSILLGILVEVAQHYFTQERSADLKDVVANVLGALSAALMMTIIRIALHRR